MDMYTSKNCLLIAATNFDEFNDLCEQALREVSQLQQTLCQLNRFDFELRLTVDNSNPAQKKGDG